MNQRHTLLTTLPAMLLLCMLCCGMPAIAQLIVADEGGISVNSVQPISFGAFTITGTAGGTVTISNEGLRTATGDIVLLHGNPCATPALFELKLCPGKRISFIPQKNLKLGTANSPPLRLELAPPGSDGRNFIIGSDCNTVTTVAIGATLHIPPQSSPGSYSGNFGITYNLE